MSRIRFNQVFAALMAFSLVTSFMLPPAWVSSAGRTQFSALLIPISRPMYHLSNFLRARVVRQPVQDTRPAETLADENARLREQIREMTAQIHQLEEQAGERARLGDLKSFCDRFFVSGADTDGREGLSIGGALTHVQVDQPVLYGDNLVGRIDRAGALSAHVRLVTDVGMVVTGHFETFSPDKGLRENTDLPLAIIRGNGEGVMTISNLALDDLKKAGIQRGDIVVLSDETWWPAVQGVRIGQIASISPLPSQSQFANIRLISRTSLLHLNDVWVMTRQP